MKLAYKLWTKKHTDQLRKLRAAGLTFSQIGVILQRTKNSVIGRAHRLGIFSQPEPEPEPEPEAVKTSVYVKPVVRVAKPAIAARHVGLAELERAECRYPVGKDVSVPGAHLFCGTPTRDKSSYCKTHHNIVWQQMPTRVRVRGWRL